MQNLFRPMEDRLIERKSLVLGSENRRGKGGQHRSVAFGALTSPGNTVEVVVSTDTAVLSTFSPPVFGTQNQGFAFDQPVLGYADAGSSVTVFISTNGSFDQAASDFVVTGYLIDCTVNVCAPIAP